jgi:integrase
VATNPIKVPDGWMIRWRAKVDGAWKWQDVREPIFRDAERARDWLNVHGRSVTRRDPLVVGRAWIVGESAAIRSGTAGVVTFGAMWDNYCVRKSGVWSDRTADGFRGKVDKHFGVWFPRSIKSLGAADLNERWAYLLDSGLSRNTAIAAIAPVKATLRLAFELGESSYNPNSRALMDQLHFTIDPDVSFRREAIERAVFRELLAHADGQARVVILLLATIGARIGEALALRVGDVNVAKRSITIAGTMIAGGVRQGWTKQERKGRKRVQPRPLPITQELADLLAPLVQGRGSAEPLFVATDGRTGKARKGGGFWHIDTWRNREWAPVVASARAGGVVLPVEFGPHNLRHSMATWLAVKLLPAQLMLRMRHADIKMTMRYYHHGADAEALERAAIEDVMGA